MQERNEVRWFPGHDASLVFPCSNTSSFGSKFTVLKKVLVILQYWDFFDAPRNDSAPRELCPPLNPRYASVPVLLEIPHVIAFMQAFTTTATFLTFCSKEKKKGSWLVKNFSFHTLLM